jgi:hypothetical protein
MTLLGRPLSAFGGLTPKRMILTALIFPLLPNSLAIPTSLAEAPSLRNEVRHARQSANAVVGF